MNNSYKDSANVSMNGLTEVNGPSFCHYGGDSGGPYFSFNVAYGIHSGGDHGCGIPGYFTEVNATVSLFNTSVAIGPL